MSWMETELMLQDEEQAMALAASVRMLAIETEKLANSTAAAGWYESAQALREDARKLHLDADALERATGPQPEDVWAVVAAFGMFMGFGLMMWLVSACSTVA